ncbi:hypothetical protein [Microlunatus sp. Gsoil 973]|uniref:hypothetical protein n=1 Tax=Microlunatus sp. Gsoil 973 TaxID=2672569 RepID=UPI0012B4FB5C|nr:hypothetical protein [Microlunatus sp. Gsoil 973]QGN33999.1 hypothetical protein GJV80_15575 [Microlunatus sp. Gsoil 973]
MTRARRGPRPAQLWFIGVTIVAVVGVLLGIHVLSGDRAYTPQAAVRQYFTALTERDADRVVDLEPDLDQQSYAISVLQSPDYRPPARVRIGEIVRTGSGRASVETSYTINDQPFTSSITVVRDARRSILGLRTWRTVRTLAGVQLNSPFFSGPKINNRLIPQNSDAVPPLLPGGYRVTSAPNPLADVPPAEVAVPVGAAGAADLTPRLKAGARMAIDPLVAEYVDRCIDAVNHRKPTRDCRFVAGVEVRAGEMITVDRYPRSKLVLSDHGIQVTTAEKGRLWVVAPEAHDRHVRYSVAGFVYLNTDNDPFFSPRI